MITMTSHIFIYIRRLLPATSSTQRTHLASRLFNITTATTGQTTIGSGTQSDFLMMGITMPETC